MSHYFNFVQNATVTFNDYYPENVELSRISRNSRPFLKPAFDRM